MTRHRSAHRAWVPGIVLTGVLAWASPAAAAPGDLDPAFGTGGKVTTDFAGYHDEARALVLQPDGKLLAAGETTAGTIPYDFALARYNPDGSLDPSFGTGGKVTTDFAGRDEQARALVLQPDGKVVRPGGLEPPAF